MTFSKAGSLFLLTSWCYRSCDTDKPNQYILIYFYAFHAAISLEFTLKLKAYFSHQGSASSIVLHSW